MPPIRACNELGELIVNLHHLSSLVRKGKHQKNKRTRIIRKIKSDKKLLVMDVL